MEITLQNAKRKFAQWRAAKRNQREKIPEELLKLASACSFKFGYRVTLKALNLSTLKLNTARKTYPEVIENIHCNNLEVNNAIQNMEFVEVKFPKCELKIDSQIEIEEEKNYQLPALYELENKFGVKLRIFSDSEFVQKRIFTAFSLGS